ncbi:hypothetical protein ACH9L7_17305 (plasmid) [Haloferax sp. S1W]|uniref:hypothetical protein n=1 Tax=Haloferax sp. S1W TaxID=3377110 RepID=UPI0037C66490
MVVALIAGVGFNAQTGAQNTESTPESFEIGSVGTDHSDGVLRLSAEVTNPDADAQTGTVALRIDQNGDGTFETPVERRQITFASGEQRDISFDQSTEKMSSGTYHYGVFVWSEDSTTEAHKSVTVDIEQPPKFRLSGVSNTISVVKGESAGLSFEVTNVGDSTRTRLVNLAVDSNGDGAFDATEEVDTAILKLEPEQSNLVSLEIPTDGLDAGTYNFRVGTETNSVSGVLTVLRPATYDIQFTSIPENVTKDDPLNASVKVTNTGDIGDTATVTFGPENGSEYVTESVTLAPGEEATLNLSQNTQNVTRGDTTFVASVGSANDSANVYVLGPYFKVTRLHDTKMGRDGTDLWVNIEARVTNMGDIPATETVRLQIDLDGDDRPERVGLNRTLTLGVGDRETISFEVPTKMNDQDAAVAPSEGTYIYGVFSDETNETGVFTVRTDSDSSSSLDGSSVNDGSTDDSATGDSTDADSTQYATLDEITQEKYGRYFDDLSGETKTQVEELRSRQPFADGYAITDVLTREELAEQKYNVDLEGESFDFHSLDIELQQQIEADFDSQFQSEDGDRYESWEELAQSMYGTDFDSLTEEQQAEVKAEYEKQFE